MNGWKFTIVKEKLYKFIHIPDMRLIRDGLDVKWKISLIKLRERVLSDGGEEMLQSYKASFEQLYDTYMWVELQRRESIPLKGKFYGSNVWQANTPK